MSIARASDVPEPVAIHCGCGQKWQQSLKRYEIVRCACGKFWWALRPRRDGPLRAFAWPGQNLKEAA